jgi:branched-chain amino acid transport system ATP-binding protein
MPKPALQASELSKSFGGLVAVDRVNLELNHVEVHAVIGPNGAGKTTLLSMLAGELSPSAGRIRLEERDITHNGSAERARLGIGRTFQRSAVIPGFSALDMVRLATLNRAGMQLLQPLASNKTSTALAQRALARVGLNDRADSVTDVLSHGEKRRVEIAAVLALDPKILLLDEPLAGLGPDESRQVVALIEDLRRDRAILLIEHDVDIVFALADRITVLDNGRVIACGTPSDIRASTAARDAYLGLEPA